MIYLIGGPPKCGKTTLAKKLSLNSKIPWVSADTIQNVIKPYVDGSDFNSIFPVSSANFSSNDEKYNLLSTDEIIKSYRAQAKSMFAAIEAFVLSEITEGNDYIVEGYHLEPQYIDTLTQSHPGKVKGIVLAKFNEEFTDDDLLLAEYGATVVGMEILRDNSQKIEVEARKKATVQIALATLSYSEIEAAVNILSELNGTEGLLVASKIADRVGITRSVIVNALRKFESAGVIESKSLGMKGTYIRVLNEHLLDEIQKLKR